MKRIITSIILVLVILLSGYAIYRYGFRKSIPQAPLQEQVQAILTQNDCYVCHSETAQLPFYSKLPLIGPAMNKHAANAVRFTDLAKGTSDINNVDEVTLAMIENAVEQKNMPIHEYKAIHWGTSFTKEEAAILKDWIASVRADKFSNGLACEEFINEPVRPVPSWIPVDEVKVGLGQRMFNDGRISKDGTISCASCHLVETGGADEPDERTSMGINDQFGGVNAPTVYNAVFNVRQFWNGRAADLQEQAAGPPVNPVEMGDQTWDDIVARLRTDKALVKEFEALYPGQGLTQATVTDAIAEFEKTLLTPDSRFDLYLKGDKTALSEQEIKGYAAFKSNACATCHVGTILGGQSFEHLGVFGDYFGDRNPEIAYNSDDDGLKGFTGNEADFQKFKVPGLRNVAITPPYFHDGTVLTLEDAVRAMAKYELDKNLSETEVSSIVAFMKSLTGHHELLKTE